MFEDEVVGHAGDVVADDAGQGVFFGPDLFLVIVWKGFRVVHPEGEELADDAFGIVFFPSQG